MRVRAQADNANSIVGRALTVGDAHVATRHVFDGVDWRTAGVRVDGSPHTLYELLDHLIFWQEGVLEWLAGRSPAMPAPVTSQMATAVWWLNLVSCRCQHRRMARFRVQLAN